MAEKKSQKKVTITWVEKAAQDQVMPIINNRKTWEAKGRLLEMEQILTALAAIYPQDANNIISVLKGELIKKKEAPRTKMKIVEQPALQATSGCADCGEEVRVYQKSFTELESVQDVQMYFNAAEDKGLALHRMKEMLRSNKKPVPKSNDLTEVSSKILSLIQSGKFMY